MPFEGATTQAMLDRERALAPAASRSAGAIFRWDETSRHEGPRLHYWRDSDRILHSFSFNRYVDKTQVFSNIEDDRISHRVIHVQFLAKIGRFVGRVLGLNEDLIEAIALGHDVGHCPFGHEGEKVLDTACTRHGVGHFHHNAQSVVFLDQVESAYRKGENPFPGLNLSAQTLDGILCHNGEVHVREIGPEPDAGKSPGDAIARLDANLDKAIGAPGSVDLQPMTLEACVVRFVDTISYIGRDIEDAITLGLITRDDIPDTLLGNTNRQVIDILVKDLIKNTMESELSKVAYSRDVHQALLALYDFNTKRIYKHETLASKIQDVPAQMEMLFEQACNDVARGNEGAAVFTDHVRLVGTDYIERYKANPAIVARDFVAGMTDRYFKRLVASLA
ncbi:MAG: HD domain-containing protein [Candidatus Lokiarchaeota archaeon]|nr:HD domain-containing protein [Candidatus Lokiarchaeota archaeon]